MPGDAQDAVDLEIERAGAIGHDMELAETIGEVDAVGPLGEEVDCGRAVEGEARGIDSGFELEVFRIQEDDDVEHVPGRALDGRGEPADPGEEEALGKREILRDLAIAEE